MQLLIIAGNVGNVKPLNSGGNGDPVLNFSIAVNNGKDSNGQERPATWYDCALWGKRAQSLQSYITKGSRLTVQGRPTVRVHDGKAYLGITINELTLMGGGERQDEAPRDDTRTDTPRGGYGAGGRPGNDDMESEIPFNMEWR